jgi:uncharacterized protein
LSYVHRQDLDWLITDFTARVADVAHAVVVSADGVPLAVSEGIPPFSPNNLPPSPQGWSA